MAAGLRAPPSDVEPLALFLDELADARGCPLDGYADIKAKATEEAAGAGQQRLAVA